MNVKKMTCLVKRKKPKSLNTYPCPSRISEHVLDMPKYLSNFGIVSPSQTLVNLGHIGDNLGTCLGQVKRSESSF